MSDSDLFPIYYNGKYYYRDHCDKRFLMNYTSRTNLHCGHSIHLGDGMGVSPDGLIYTLD